MDCNEQNVCWYAMQTRKGCRKEVLTAGPAGPEKLEKGGWGAQGMLVLTLERRQSVLTSEPMLGVFATAPIKAEQLIGRYCGKPLDMTVRKFRSKALPSPRWDYVMEDNGKLIDGHPSHPQSNWVALINSKRTRRQNRFVNVRIVSSGKAKKIALHNGQDTEGMELEGVWYVTTKDIAKGEELVTDYGERYWTAEETNARHVRF